MVLVWLFIGLGCFDIIQSDKGQVYNKLPTSLPGIKSADIGAKPLLLRISDKTGSWGNADGE